MSKSKHLIDPLLNKSALKRVDIQDVLENLLQMRLGLIPQLLELKPENGHFLGLQLVKDSGLELLHHLDLEPHELIEPLWLL